MNILHFAGYYYPHIGGIEQTARDIVNALGDSYNQRIICFNSEKTGCVIEKVDGVQVVRAKLNASVASQQLSFSFKKLLNKQFKEFRPDVLVFHYPNPFAAHYVLKQLKKHSDCKLIVYWHLDITKQKFLGKLFTGQNKRLLRRATKIIATSPNYLEGSVWLRSVRNKCAVIPSCIHNGGFGISEATLSQAKKIREKNCGKTICFALGRHVEYKGLEYLIRASRLLGDGYKIYIGGEGPLTPSLKALAEGDEKIEFIGKLPDGEIAAYFAACDIFCFPSVTKNEAFGLALAEAMSYSKPCITFTIEGSGVNYVCLNGVTGIEVENANAQQFAEAIETLAGDAALREKMGAAAGERVRELFTKEKFVENVREIFEQK